jgi:hypothetical protein
MTIIIISQGIRGFNLRKCRYIELEKPRLPILCIFQKKLAH